MLKSLASCTILVALGLLVGRLPAGRVAELLGVGGLSIPRWNWVVSTSLPQSFISRPLDSFSCLLEWALLGFLIQSFPFNANSFDPMSFRLNRL